MVVNLFINTKTQICKSSVYNSKLFEQNRWVRGKRKWKKMQIGKIGDLSFKLEMIKIGSLGRCFNEFGWNVVWILYGVYI